ncbi:AIM24 family protein [Streptomyces sp. NPDC089799]|uniref:AIM24 family protein n=1 Tax=Streptomyces sp. NPDC089799 TaxID=3155066 RepID=UPI00342759C0
MTFGPPMDGYGAGGYGAGAPGPGAPAPGGYGAGGYGPGATLPGAPAPAAPAAGPKVLDPYALPSDDNVNAYTFCVELKGSQWFLQKGKMIAYYGQIEFNGIGNGRFDRLLRTSFHSPLHASDWVVAEGQGKMLLADRAFDVNSYDLEDGNLTIRSGNLLAYQPTLALKQSIVPGFLTLIGTGKFVAASNGPVVFMEPPLRVDPQALVGWADCPSPCHHYDHGYMSGVMGGLRQLAGIGGASGEEHQFEFVGAGTVLLQSSEMLMAEQPVGVVGAEPGVPGHGPYAQGGHGQQGQLGIPRMPGQLGDLQRRFGL